MRTQSGAPPYRGILAALYGAAALAATACTQPQDVSTESGVSRPLTVDQFAVPSSGLVGEWKLDQTSGTTAIDTKNGFDATVFGGAQFIPGKLGRALDLNNGSAGTGGKYAEMPSNATLDNVQEGDYTISAWFYAYSVPTNTVVENRNWAIVSKSGQNMGLFYTNGQQFSARHYLAGDVLVDANSGTTFAPNAWHHVAGVVSKSGGTVKIYVDGTLEGTGSFTAGTLSKEYNSRPFRIGKNTTTWAADGKVDQVRIYTGALTASQVADLAHESTGFRFPVGMYKGTQSDLLGMNYVPDGLMTAGSVTSVTAMLDAARDAGARITIRVTGGNNNFQTNGDRIFVLSKWKAAFDDVSGMDMSGYLRDGTLLAHYAIDEPFADFDNMTGATLEQMCAYQKSFPGWRSVPCIIRDKNTTLYSHAPTGGYKQVDAGWAQLTDHHYIPASTGYDGNMMAYFQDNLAKGRAVGLGLMYGFNLLNGGREFTGCESPADPNNCAMTPTEVRQEADTLAKIGSNQGAGVIGYEIEATAGTARDYFFRSDVQSALQYLQSKLGGLQPGPLNIRGDLPPP